MQYNNIIVQYYTKGIVNQMLGPKIAESYQFIKLKIVFDLIMNEFGSVRNEEL